MRKSDNGSWGAEADATNAMHTRQRCGTVIAEPNRGQIPEIGRLLLEHGADPNLPEEGIAPRGHALYAAATNQHYGAARAVHLLAYDNDIWTAAAVFAANPILANDPGALANAAGEAHKSFVRLMLRCPPDLARRLTFPGWSVGAKTPELNELLFEHGLDPSAPDWLGVTPLHELARKGRGNMVQGNRSRCVLSVYPPGVARWVCLLAIGLIWWQGPPTTTLLPAVAGSPPVRTDAFVGSTAGDEREIGGVRLCWCPPGTFLMGSPPEETGHRPDEARVKVTMKDGFWIGKYEVTQGQWKRIAGEFPDRKPSARWGAGEVFPVYWINFLEAEEFCRKLTGAGHESGELPTGSEFRIPTEAQWEYACRAGTTAATALGNHLGRRDANFSGAPLGDGEDGPPLHRASPVGSYPANPWGIHDMHGNIFEWCRDWYYPKLPGGSNPDLYSTAGTPNRDGTYSRVRRGGAWNDDGVFCRSALRLRYEPHRRSDHIGFRVVAVRP